MGVGEEIPLKKRKAYKGALGKSDEGHYTGPTALTRGCISMRIDPV